QARSSPPLSPTTAPPTAPPPRSTAVSSRSASRASEVPNDRLRGVAAQGRQQALVIADRGEAHDPGVDLDPPRRCGVLRPADSADLLDFEQEPDDEQVCLLWGGALRPEVLRRQAQRLGLGR